MQVEKSWVSEEWLNRAKGLIKEHGVTDITKISEALGVEFDLQPSSEVVGRLIVIAIRETDSGRPVPQAPPQQPQEEKPKRRRGKR